MRKILNFCRGGVLASLFIIAILAHIGCSNSSGGGSPTVNYTVTFDANGGTITTATQTVPANTATALKTAAALGLSREGYTFGGWAKASSATTADYADGANVTLTANLKLYAIWTAAPTPATTIDLSAVTADTVIADNTTVTGTLGANVKISIADGATVTLKDVTINGTDSDSYKWAGLTCAGGATIKLEGTNTVKGFWKYYPGVFVPKGKTLTIQGTGSLNASNGSAAGIGGCYTVASTSGIPKDEGSCGTIVIEGGTITATGGMSAGIGCSYGSDCDGVTITGGTVAATGGIMAAGIGSGGSNSVCGPISISGGTVTAEGGEYAAGVGTGYLGNSECGAITVANTVTKFKATKGTNATDSVGHGKNGGTCGAVTIGGTEYWDGAAYQNDGATVLGESPFVYKPNFKRMEQATADDIGKVIGADGYIYANKAAAEAEGTTASAMIAYVGSATEPTNSDINASMEGHAHGLAIALSSAGSWQASWSAAKTSAASYAAARPARASTWRLPSAYQWMWMLKGCGSNITPTTNIGNALEFQNGNISDMSQACGGGSIYNKYWTSTEKDGSNAYECRCDNEHKFQSASKSQDEFAGIWAIAIFAF